MGAVTGPGGDGPVGDVVEIRGLRLSGICGVLDHEQAQPQPLEIDLDLGTDLTAAGASDDLTDTIDYAGVIDAVTGIVASGRPALLEHLAATIADACLADARVVSVTVAVRKLRPPVPQLVDTTGVRIARRR
jgi:dihydroneopterin aldolase